jgi:nucleoside-diphosphate-sugar epimerase
MKKIIITGGAGFIGSNLCRKLLDSGSYVIAIDNFITSSGQNLKHLKKYPNFKFLKHDIIKPFTKSQLILFKDVTHIFHLACPTGVPNLLPLGEEMLLTSSIGTKNILDLALKHKARVIFTSTSEVYGDPLKFPQDEGYTGNVNPVGPRSTYEEGKRFAESLCALYVRKYGLDCRVVRVFNTYGPNMSSKDKRVIPHFIESIKTNTKLPLHGDGSQKRTFCYVDDLVDGLILIAQKGKKGEVYNLGSDEEIAIKDLAIKIAKILNRKLEVKNVERPAHDHKRRMPDLSKVYNIGWRKKVSLDEGLKVTLESMKV